VAQHALNIVAQFACNPKRAGRGHRVRKDAGEVLVGFNVTTCLATGPGKCQARDE
jgi:hypothetical protein